MRAAARAMLVSALTVALVPVLGANPAFACSCAAATDKEHFRNADVVFKGKLAKVTPPPARKDGLHSSADPATYEFQATRVYKGEVVNPLRLTSAVSGASCGLELSGQGPFLVFANERDPKYDRPNKGEPRLTANLCGGTRVLEPNEKVPFGPGKPAKFKTTHVVPKDEQPTARAQAAVPSNVAFPAVAALLGVTLGAAAWATRTKPAFSRRRP